MASYCHFLGVKLSVIFVIPVLPPSVEINTLTSTGGIFKSGKWTNKKQSSCSSFSTLKSKMAEFSSPGTPSGRHEKSLGLLTTKFVNLLQDAKDGVLDLKMVCPFKCLFVFLNLFLKFVAFVPSEFILFGTLFRYLLYRPRIRWQYGRREGSTISQMF